VWPSHPMVFIACTVMTWFFINSSSRKSHLSLLQLAMNDRLCSMDHNLMHIRGQYSMLRKGIDRFCDNIKMVLK
jgi:hypothetical protein